MLQACFNSRMKGFNCNIGNILRLEPAPSWLWPFESKAKGRSGFLEYDRSRFRTSGCKALRGPVQDTSATLAISANFWIRSYGQQRLAIDFAQRIPGDFVHGLQPFRDLIVSKPYLCIGENVIEYRLA